MDIKEAAKTLGVSTKTLRRYIKKGLIEARKGSGQGGQAWDISESNLEDFKQKLQSGLIHPTVEKLDSGGQRNVSLVKLDKSGTVGQEMDTSGQLSLDIGHGVVAHPENFKVGKLGTQLDELPDICTVAEAAIFLKTSIATVREMLRNGELKGRKVGKGWRISKNALARFAKGLG